MPWHIYTTMMLNGDVHIICVEQWSGYTVYYKTVYMFCLCVFVGSRRMPSSVLPSCHQPMSRCKLPSTTTHCSLHPVSAGSMTKLRLTLWADCIVHLREVWSLPWWRTLAGHCPIRLSVRRCRPPLNRWHSVWCITTLGWLSWLRHRLCVGLTGVSFIVSACKSTTERPSRAFTRFCRMPNLHRLDAWCECQTADYQNSSSMANCPR